jgi:hypothetical protein
MIEATHSLQQAQAAGQAQSSTVIAPAVRARMGRAVRVEALRRAKADTKRALQAQGLKLAAIPHKEIVAAAEARLLANAAYRAKLIAEARAVVDRWTAEGFFGKRAALAAQNSEHLRNSESRDWRGLSLNETHAQNGATR